MCLFIFEQNKIPEDRVRNDHGVIKVIKKHLNTHTGAMIKMSPAETGSMISTLHSPIEGKGKRGAYITKLVAIM